MRGAFVAGVVAVVTLAGCGGKSGDQEARDTASAFAKAVAAHDGAKACSLLSDQGKATYSQLGDVPCPTGVLALQIAGAPKVQDVRVRGATATVGLREATGRRFLVFLRRRGGHWRVDSSDASAGLP